MDKSADAGMSVDVGMSAGASGFVVAWVFVAVYESAAMD